MIQINNFEIISEFYISSNTIVYKAIRLYDNKKVIIKMLSKEYPTIEELNKFKYEYEIAKTLSKVDGVIKVYDLITVKNSYAIVMEDIEGVSLDQLIKKINIDLLLFLELSISIAKILGEIHKNNIIHKDIKPSNIIINLKNKKIRIIDFCISSELLRENQEAIHPDHLEGTLAYISPEQTGRMNRSIDYRSDYYSLGITFYEMLVKKLPFNSYDPIELVHDHIAKEAVEPHKINNEIPKALSNIIKKMMSKNAENRYQSSLGLIKDLQSCLTQLTYKKTINYFVLGKFDISDKLYIPEKLYGRNKEIEILLNSFDNILKGNKEIVFLTGAAGIGKTSIVNEIQKSVIKNKGYFASGKYEQLKKNIPYYALSQAFQELIRYILTEKKERLKIWKEKIIKAVGVNGQLLINLIPELELIIGKQPDVQKLSYKDSQNRLNTLFINFIKVFADIYHPLVIFIDDLHWADSESITLIEQILNEQELNYLLFIGSYRDKDINSFIIDNLIINLSNKKNLKKVFIEPLKLDDIKLMLSETFKHGKKEINEFAVLVHEKTIGNPFFIKEFLKSLYEKKMINFNNKWIINIKKINKFEITDNVIEFLSERILSLESEALNILKFASCLSNIINLRDLAVLNNTNEHSLLLIIRYVLNLGFLIKFKNNVKFIHDKVKEAVYSNISENEKNEYHFKIGLYFLNEYKQKKDEDIIYIIVDHLNLAKSLLDENQKKILKVLNFKAGLKAKASASFVTANNYFKYCNKLLLNNPWENDYKFTLQFYTEWAETEYIATNMEEANKIIDLIIRKGKSIFDKVKAQQITLRFYANKLMFDEAINLGIKLINEFKYKFHNLKSINFFLLLIELIKFNFLINQRKKELKVKRIEDLINLPVTKDKKFNEILNILLLIGQCVYSKYPDKYPYLILKLSNIALKYGLTDQYFGGFMPLAGVFIIGLKKYEIGYQLGILDFKLLNKTNNKYLNCFSKTMFGIMVNHYKKHARDAISLFIEAYYDGLDSGNNQYTAYAINHICMRTLLTEKNLEDVKVCYDKYSQVHKRLKQSDADTYFYPSKQFVYNMLNLVNNKFILKGDFFNEIIDIEYMKKHQFTAGLGIYFTFKLMLVFILGDYKSCYSIAGEGKNYLKENIGMFQNYFLIFFICLTYINNFEFLNKKEKKKAVSFVRKYLNDFKLLTGQCSENFRHLYLLLLAEIYKINKNINKSMYLYDEAIKSAKDNEYVFIEALANELAGRFYHSKGMNKIFQIYLIEACYCYIKWGAKAKVEELQKEYPDLFNYFEQNEYRNIDIVTKTLSTVSYPVRNKASTSLPIKSFDIAAILKATQAISSEIKMDNLLKALVKIVIENAGAQKGVFIINKKNELFIEAYSSINNKDAIILQSMLINKSNDISLAVVNYVFRTKETIKLDDALNKGLFVNDPYIQENKIKSILCQPIIFQNNISGILYLENNLAIGAFTDEHLEVLNVISTQAAISIHNIYLYDSIKVKELLEKELKLASEIQKSMLPDKMPEIKGYDLSTVCYMSKESGGDFYDIIKINDRNYLILIGDIAGKGLPAALYMSSVINMLRLLIVTYIGKNDAFFHTDFLRSLLEQLNTVLKNIMKKDSFVTLILGLLNIEKHNLIYTSSGHVPGYYYNPIRKKISILKTKGMACGSLPAEVFNQRIEQKELKINKNCFLFFNTDGITEARNQNDNEYSDRYVEIIKSIKMKDNSSSALEKLIDDYKQFTNNEALFDDLTLICVKRKEKQKFVKKINDVYFQVKTNIDEYFNKSLKDVNKKDFLKIMKGIIFEYNEEESFLKLTVTTNCFPIPIQLTLIQTIFQDLLYIITKNKGLVTDLLIVIDEVISNIIEHSYKNSGDELIIFDFLFYNNKLILIIKDFGKNGNKLDIQKEGVFESKDYMLKNVIKTKRGMGIYMIKKIMDEVNYDCKGNNINILTLTKKFNNLLFKYNILKKKRIEK